MPTQIHLISLSPLSAILLAQLGAAQYDTPLNTTHDTVGWVYGPNYRSTSDIIFSCLITMGLCVWSALHLNIPAVTEGRARAWIRNIGWVGLGVFGPELVMFAAWKQWISARALQHMMHQDIKCPSCPSPKLTRSLSLSNTSFRERKSSIKTKGQMLDWTIMHGYYATMGGFVIDLDGDTASIIMNKTLPDTRLTLTPQGLQLLVDCNLIPDIETREIVDKNKADALAKAIVILQAGWMLIQAISRLAYHLPVTLLEVNTIGHVICALFIYVLWWKKPRKVTEPTILKGPWIPAMAAYMMISSDIDHTEGWLEWIKLKPEVAPELGVLTFQQEQSQLDRIAEVIVKNNSTTLARSEEHVDFIKHAQKPGFGSLGLASRLTPHSLGVKRQKSFHYHFDLTKIEAETQVHRWKLALDAMEMFPHLICRLHSLQGAIDSPSYRSQVMLQLRASNWPRKGSIPPYRGKIMGMALWFASIAFGVVHVSAWNEYFPSTLEKWLWRISSLYLAWAGGLWLSINLVGAMSKRFEAMWDIADTGRAPKTVYLCLIPICFVCGTAYAFARTYLVAEAVISLRQMPPEMYWTPNWPEVIPHL